MANSQVESAWPTYRILGVSSLVLTVVGYVGLWLVKRIQEHQEISERELMQTTIGSAVVWTFAACFFTGLLVMFPLAVYVQKRSGVSLPGRILPNWIARPVQAVVVIIIAMMLVLWIASLVTLLFGL